MKLVCMADTHGFHEQVSVPDGDVLIHAGDITAHGTPKEMREFNEWLATLDFDRILLVPGNHDVGIQEKTERSREILSEATILIDEEVELDGHTVYGTPHHPPFKGWAFERENPTRKTVFKSIPQQTDILITHAPMRGTNDRVMEGDRVGDRLLRDRVEELDLDYHIHGHIHEAHHRYGTHRNCTIVDRGYDPVYRPQVIEL